jgi:hypothetical protein
MIRTVVCLCVAFLAAAIAVQADETIRQVQEELRKRNLYFGDIDGRNSPELSGALKRYQSRKGFEVTGAVDDETAASLQVKASLASTRKRESWPDVPILKSDSARAIPEPQRIALEKAAEENLDASPSPVPPAESPAPEQNLTPERVTKFVENYLRDAETADVAAQGKYYAFPIAYFDHGSVDQQFVARDTGDYVKRWPERKYKLIAPVSFFASGKEGETNVEFTIAFNVKSKARAEKNVASGRTRNFWTIRPEGDDLKIIAIKEQRIRE